MNRKNQVKPVQDGNGIELNGLLQRLQVEDARNLRNFNLFRYIFMVMIVIYTLMFVVNPMRDLEWPTRISGICYVLAFVVFTCLFQKYYKEYKAIDYAVPVVEMLIQAAKRYDLKQRKSLILIIPVLLIDVGLSISFARHTELFPVWKWIGLIQVFYFSAMAISFGIGVMFWYKRQRPLRMNALSLLQELES